MPKKNQPHAVLATGANIELVSHSPDHGDGTIRQGDTVAFAITPVDSGVISLYGSRDGQIYVSWALVRGELSTVLAPSLFWEAHPGPLHVDAYLRELDSVSGDVVTLAQTAFEIAG